MSTDRSQIQVLSRVGIEKMTINVAPSTIRATYNVQLIIVLLTSKRKWYMAEGQYSKGLNSNTIKTHNDDGLYL